MVFFQKNPKYRKKSISSENKYLQKTEQAQEKNCKKNKKAQLEKSTQTDVNLPQYSLRC